MRVLEARFHPHKKTGLAVIVVGRVLCGRSLAWIEATPVIAAGRGDAADTGARLEKLRFLVARCGPAPCDELLSLPSEFWSFVEIIEQASTPGVSPPRS